MVIIRYNRQEIMVFSQPLSAENLGVMGKVLRQTVKSADRKFDIAFEITNDGPVVEDSNLKATETVFVSRGRDMLYSASFATTGNADGATDLGVYRNCPLGAKLEILSATEGRITFCKK